MNLSEKRLRSSVGIDVLNYKQRLREVKKSDPTVKIKIAELGEAKIDGRLVKYWAAEIGEQVKAHVHFNSDENYIVMEGKGLMFSGPATRFAEEVKVDWQLGQEVSEGDVFTIPAGYAHSLKNTEDRPLIIIFSGSSNDLTTDRTMVPMPLTV